MANPAYAHETWIYGYYLGQNYGISIARCHGDDLVDRLEIRSKHREITDDLIKRVASAALTAYTFAYTQMANLPRPEQRAHNKSEVRKLLEEGIEFTVFASRASRLPNLDSSEVVPMQEVAPCAIAPQLNPRNALMQELAAAQKRRADSNG